MGCASSTDTVVQPLRTEDVKGDEDETGKKVDGRGDSAVSKATRDSGVVMENRAIPTIPGALPGQLTQDGLLQLERRKSSEILEELLYQGIIQVGQTGERGSGAGEAYSIMLDDREGVSRRRPPARLESLKAKKAQSLPSIEGIEEKIRLAEERRQLREDEFKARLRTKSARVSGPVAALPPTGPLSLSPSPLTPEPLDPMLGKAFEVGDCAREAAGDGTVKAGDSGNNRRAAADRIGEDGDGEEIEEKEDEEKEDEEEKSTQVEEFQKDYASSGELENDSSFQRAVDKEEIF